MTASNNRGFAAPAAVRTAAHVRRAWRAPRYIPAMCHDERRPDPDGFIEVGRVLVRPVVSWGVL
jgi:hypothetical protein